MPALAPVSLGPRLRRLLDWLGFALLWAWIAVSFLFVPAMLGHPTVGVVLSLVAAVLAWQAAEAKRHPVTTVGTRREVTVHPITERGRECDECGAPAGGGERRRYVTRRILFGTTIAVPEWGENRYCQSCADDPAREIAPETEASGLHGGFDPDDARFDEAERGGRSDPDVDRAER